jgi:hypothetical protein
MEHVETLERCNVGDMITFLGSIHRHDDKSVVIREYSDSDTRLSRNYSGIILSEPTIVGVTIYQTVTASVLINDEILNVKHDRMFDDYGAKRPLWVVKRFNNV